MNGLLGLLGADEPLPALKVLLPVGISFYTFAAISYAVDVYRGTIKPAKSVIHYLAWATLFPYIMAGPIIRYEHVGQQLEGAQQRFRWALIGSGLFFLVMGLAKKLLFADVLATYVNDLFAHHAELSLLSGWGAALGYTLQLYFDFSGYSDMAVGVALMIGLRFPQNFNSPYKAANVSDFWRRWHMTLSGWLRDYLFIPLGGSRGRQLLTVRNLLITFLLGGLWHGPAWTYVIWGLLWGTYLSVHSTLRKYGFTPKWVWLNRVITFLCAVVAWVFFRATTVDSALDVLGAMIGLNGVSGGWVHAAGPSVGRSHRRRPPVGEFPAEHVGDQALAEAPLRASARACSWGHRCLPSASPVPSCTSSSDALRRCEVEAPTPTLGILGPVEQPTTAVGASLPATGHASPSAIGLLP